MSLFFFLNNVHFALEILGAVAMLMAAWLTVDTYSVKKDVLTLIRAVGFGLLALYQIINAIALQSDVLSYVGFIALLLGLVLILGSFLKKQVLQYQAIIVLPAFTLWSGTLHIVAFLLFALIAYFSYRRSKEEMNRAQMPFSLGFLFLAFAFLLEVFYTGNQTGIVYIFAHVAKLVGYLLIARWVWQYLQLRIQESLVIILISSALFLSTLVTLAFSMILISQVTAQTASSLLTDVRVLDLHIKSLEQEALVKTQLLAKDSRLADAIAANDFSLVENLSEEFLEKYSLGFVTITDLNGSVLVRAHALSRRGDSLMGERAFEEALRDTPFVTVEYSIVENISIRSGALITSQGKAVGAVIAGYPLDNALVDNIKRITGLEMFIYKEMVPVAATALASDGRTRLIGNVLTNSDIERAVLAEGKTITARTEILGQPFHASYLPLSNGDSKIVGMISAAKPEQDILDIANATNRLTLITVLFVMLLLLYPIFLLTRRLTKED